jgi:MFS family permease
MADAMEMMVLSILAPSLTCEWDLNEYKKALITMVVFCGMMLSSPIWGKICDRFGRRVCLFLCTIVTFSFGFGSSFSSDFTAILILRGLVGFGIGGAPQSVTLYSEFLPSKQRARCVVFSNIFWSIGACFEVLLAVLVMPKLGWRWLLGFSALPLIVFLIFCIWLPESPRFHLTSNRPDLALQTLKRVAEDNKTSLPEGNLAIIKVNPII